MGRWSAVVARSLAAVLLAACAAPGGRAAGGQSALYVASALDDSLTRLDGESGHVIGPPLPAGRAPGQLVPGPRGSLLALSVAAGHDGEVTHLARAAGRVARGWSAQPLPLGEPARVALLAGDGAGAAVVGYHVPAPTESDERDGSDGACRVALVDVSRGLVRRAHTVCDAREVMTGLALAGGSGGGIAFVGLSRRAAGPDGGPPSGHRIVALNAETGAVVASRATAGSPEHLTVAPGPGRGALRLYCLVGADYADAEEMIPARGSLLGLDPATLATESELRLPAWPRALAVAPDGGRAYGLTPGGGSLMELDLGRGLEARRTELPGRGTRLAVGERWVYVANTVGDEVWQLDRGDGRLARSIPVGRRPIGLALGPA